MASVNRPNSKQDYCSPPDLLAAVQERFGQIQFDLACTLENAVAPMGYAWPQYNALERDWRDELAGLTCWCNPPFALAGEFARKAAESQARGAPWNAPAPRILLLVQASVGSNWFAEYVHGKARVFALSPRVKFVGMAQGINRDLMLCCYGPWQPDFLPWRWKS